MSWTSRDKFRQINKSLEATELMTSDSPQSADLVLAVFGVGLLGGSVATGAKERGLARRVIGIGRNPERLQAAVDRGIIDEFVTDPAQADGSWDLAVVATPVDRIPGDVRAIASASRPGAVVTDVGSVKASICESIGDFPADGVSFVGSHPLAGSEQSGFEAARPDLFEGRVTVVANNGPASAVSRVSSFWSALGATVVPLDPKTHDEALATTSHLPHAVAAALASILQSDQRILAASGFRDTTRIAAGDPDLWVPILLSNADALEASLDRFAESFELFRTAIRNRDVSELQKLLQDAKTSRDAL